MSVVAWIVVALVVLLLLVCVLIGGTVIWIASSDKLLQWRVKRCQLRHPNGCEGGCNTTCPVQFELRRAERSAVRP
jgi:uncharacterized membrane protein